MRRHISYLSEIIKGHLLQKRIPVLVTLCVTDKCNLKCVYCYKENYKKVRSDLTTKELLGLIEELALMGAKYISLNGGEALLRDDLGIIVDKIKEKKMLCHLSTNGLLVKNNIPLLKKMDSLAVSIDGLKENNDINRGQGSYDRIIEAIGYLRANNIKFHTHTVLTRNNKNAVEQMLELARQYRFLAQLSILRQEDSAHKDISMDDDELKAIIRKIIHYKRLGRPVFFSYDAYNNMLEWPLPYQEQTICGDTPKGYKPKRCFIKKFSCHIEADGSVYPCIVLVNKFKALNFLEHGFEAAWGHLALNQCKACYNICCNDLGMIFGLNRGSLWNAVKIVADRVLSAAAK